MKNVTTSETIGIFLNKARKVFPGKGFGLVLTNNLEKMEHCKLI